MSKDDRDLIRDLRRASNTIKAAIDDGLEERILKEEEYQKEYDLVGRLRTQAQRIEQELLTDREMPKRTRHLRWCHANSGENHAFVVDLEVGETGEVSLCGVVTHPGEIKTIGCLVDCKICKQCVSPLSMEEASEAVQLRDRLRTLFAQGDPVLKLCGEEIVQFGADILAHMDTPFRKDTISAVLLTVFEIAVVNDEKVAQWEHYRLEHAPTAVAKILSDLKSEGELH